MEDRFELDFPYTVDTVITCFEMRLNDVLGDLPVEFLLYVDWSGWEELENEG